MGRSGEASVMASTRSLDTAVSYSHSRGVFGGMSVEGAYVTVRDDVNRKFYGRDVDPRKLLDGTMPAPNAAAPLYHKLEEYEALYGIAHGYFYEGSEQSQSSPSLASGNDLYTSFAAMEGAGPSSPGPDEYD